MTEYEKFLATKTAGAELKGSYYRQSVANLRKAETDAGSQVALFK
jgi:hypothetical protein